MNRLFSAWWMSGLAVIAGGVSAESAGDAGVAASVEVTPRFATPRTTVWSGATQAVVFELDEPAAGAATLDATVEPAGLAEVVGEVTVVPGATHGVVRLRGLGVGAGELRVGDATVELEARDLPAGSEPAFVEPRLATPTMGAQVWGEITVAVELFDEATLFPGELRTVSVEVEPAAGVRLVEAEDTEREHGPSRTVVFGMDVSDVEPGTTLRLRASATHGDVVRRSPWTSVGVVRATPDRLIDLEAEAQLGVERPERYRRELVARDHKLASGGQFVPAYGSNTPVPVLVETGGGGWYQAMARVAADAGGGAWPSVGLRVGEANDPITGGIAAVGDGWRRITIGRPIWLDGGTQTALFNYENDFFGAKRSDRNLRIDRVELLRVDQGPSFAGLTPPQDAGAMIDSADLRVTPMNVWHGRPISGRWVVDAMVKASDAHGVAAPLVSMELDGRRVMSQRAWRPRFELPATMLNDGLTSFRLVAELPDGRVAASPEQTVIGRPVGDGFGDEAAMVTRIAVDDVAAWDELGDAKLDREGRWGRVARMMSNGTIGLSLPAGLEGRYAVSVLANGDEHEGRPIGEVALRGGDGEVVHAFEPREFRKGWREVRVGEAQFDGNVRRLTVAFTNDKYDGTENHDRNLHVAAVVLRPLPTAGVKDAPPTVELRYPVAGAKQQGVDAVVVDLGDDRGVKWAELLIDGEATAVRVAPLRGGGRAVLPVIWRDAKPGTHTLAVRISDTANQHVETEPVTVEVLAEPPTASTPYDRAVRLLDRFAFGVQPDVLAELLIEGERAWLERSLTTGWSDPGVAASWHLALARHNDNQPAQSATTHLLNTPNPVRARLTMFVDNHFNTWARKAEGHRKAAEHERFVELGAAPFLALLEASATSPAMLRYLDQNRSFGGRINENYAREIMELHTLGVDSTYAQQDVTELSHVLAGWLSNEEADTTRLPRRETHRFQFTPQLNDGKPRTVFGLPLPQAEPADRYDRPRRVVEMLAAHPDTARYLATKLVESYLVSPAPEALVDEVADAFSQHGGDMGEVMLALTDHPYATDSHLEPRLQRPLEFAVGLARPIDPGNTWRVINVLKRSGVGMFDRETPDGYDAEPQSYANSNAMLQRWSYARELEWHLSKLLPHTMRAADAHPRWQSAPEDLRDADWSQAVVDVLATRITGSTLGPRSNHAALDVLAAAPENRDDRARAIATFIAQLPESQQRR
ncbi:MAG: DUF1800 family protein [Planctomycetota bacterium]